MVTRIEKPLTIVPAHNVKHIEQGNGAPLWLKELRKAELKRLSELTLPTLKDEEWKYTNVTPIAQRQYTIPASDKILEIDHFHRYRDHSEISIVFVNGIFSFEYSTLKKLPKGVTIMNLSQALKEYEKLISPLFLTNQLRSEDVFTRLNNTFFHDGAFIKIDDDIVMNQFIHIVHITSGLAQEGIIFPRSFIYLGESSEADILESHISFSDDVYFANSTTDIFLSQNAKLHYCKAQSESMKAFHIGTTRIRQEKDSQLESFSSSTGGIISRHNLSVALNGEGSSVLLNGLYATRETQLVDNHTAVEHKVPHCISNQLYKGILDGNSRAVFNGKIFVRKEAQQTNSYQLNKNLLLGSGCQVNTKPQLEIFADDVRCTHGATIGQLNEDEIFYLQTRGIAKKSAVKMLSRGFVNDVLNRIPNETIRIKLDSLITDVFSVLQ